MEVKKLFHTGNHFSSLHARNRRQHGNDSFKEDGIVWFPDYVCCSKEVQHYLAIYHGPGGIIYVGVNEDVYGTLKDYNWILVKAGRHHVLEITATLDDIVYF